MYGKAYVTVEQVVLVWNAPWESTSRERWSTCGGALIYAPALSAQLSSATAPALLGWRLAFLLLLLFVLPLFLLLLLCRYFFSISKWLQKLNTCFFRFFYFSTVCSARRRSCVGSQVALADRASAIDKSITSCVLP